MNFFLVAIQCLVFNLAHMQMQSFVFSVSLLKAHSGLLFACLFFRQHCVFCFGHLLSKSPLLASPGAPVLVLTSSQVIIVASLCPTFVHFVSKLFVSSLISADDIVCAISQKQKAPHDNIIPVALAATKQMKVRTLRLWF